MRNAHCHFMEYIATCIYQVQKNYGHKLEHLYYVAPVQGSSSVTLADVSLHLRNTKC